MAPDESRRSKVINDILDRPSASRYSFNLTFLIGWCYQSRKVMEDLSVTRNLKKATRILEFLRRREVVTSVVVVFVVVFVIVVEATHCVAPPLQLSLKPLACLRRLPGGKRGTTLELFVQLFFPRFETFQRHFNERTRSILVAAQPSPPPSARTEARHFFPDSFPVGVTSPFSYAYAIPTGPPLNAESALFQLRERQ